MELVPNFPPLGPGIAKLVVTSPSYGPQAILPYQGLNFYSPQLDIIVTSEGVGIFVPPDLFGSGPTGPAGPMGLPGPTGPGYDTLLTTKGDIVTFSTQPIRYPVGADNTILTADSSFPEGIRWKDSAILDNIRLTGNAKMFLGTSPNDYVIICDFPAASRVINMPDPGMNANFILSEGNKTINGVTTIGATSGSLFFPSVGLGGTPQSLYEYIQDFVIIDCASDASVGSSLLNSVFASFFSIRLTRIGKIVNFAIIDDTFFNPGTTISPAPNVSWKNFSEFPSLTPIPAAYRPAARSYFTAPMVWGPFIETLTQNALYFSAGPNVAPWQLRIDTNGNFTFRASGNFLDVQGTSFGSQPDDYVGIREMSFTYHA